MADETGLRAVITAASAGRARAQTALGYRYAQGRGVRRDDALAMVWFYKAAQQGFAEAQFRLATGYARGKGLRRDPVRALRWFRRAAEQGYEPRSLPGTVSPAAQTQDVQRAKGMRTG